LLFVVDVDFGEALARCNECPKYILAILRYAFFAGRRTYGFVGSSGAALRVA
jgi:hypothetical protein